MEEIKLLLDSLDTDVSASKSLSFDTPGGGEGSNTRAPVQFGTELAHVTAAQQLCLGQIGETKVCLCLLGRCGVASHKKNKVSTSVFPSSSFLLVGSEDKRSWGFLDTILDTSSLPEAFIQSLLGRSNEDWAQVFEMVRGHGIASVEEEEEMVELTRTVKKAKYYETPSGKRVASSVQLSQVSDTLKKAKRSITDAPSAEAIREELDGTRGANGSPSREGIRRFYEQITERIDTLVTFTMGLQHLIEVVAQTYLSDMLSVEETLSGVDGLVTMLKGQVGSRTSAAMVGPSAAACSPTLWGSVAGVHERCVSLEEQCKGLAEGLTRACKTMVAIKQGGVSTSSGGTPSTASVVSGLTGQGSAQTTGGLTPDPFFGGAGFQQAPGGGSSAGGSSGVSGSGNSIPSFPTGGAGGGGGGGGSSHGGSSGGTSAGVSFSPSVGGAGRDIGQRILSLERRVDVLEAGAKGGDNSAISLEGGYVLRSRSDLHALLERFLGAGCSVPSGAFVSPHYLLNQVMATMGSKLPELVEFSRLKTLEIGRVDSDMAKAVMTLLPHFMTGGRVTAHIYKAAASIAARWKAFPSNEEWGMRTDEESLQHKCTAALEEIVGAIREHIAERLHHCVEIRLIANCHLDKCHKFVSNIFDYMSEYYERMTAAFDSKAEAWDLGCFRIEQIFQNKLRGPLLSMKLADFTDARSMLLNTVWTNLRLGAIVDSFNSVGLHNHPALSAAMVRFIIKQAKAGRRTDLGPQVKEQAASIKELKELVVTQAAKLKDLEGKLGHVESRADKACNAAGVTDKKRGAGGGGK